MAKDAERVILLGSTGSIGGSALAVLRDLGHRYRLVGVAACRKWEALHRQVLEFGVEACAASDERAGEALRRTGIPARVYSGETAMVDLIESTHADVVLSAVSGTQGLRANLQAVRRGMRLAIANKEALVMAGSLLTRQARAMEVEILPMDSEHSAIFQALHCGRREDVAAIHLTASGGPFRRTHGDLLDRVSPGQALCHPKWNMGPKVTIDSATLMNKALEIIEAHWLFGTDVTAIRVVIHPQCIVHSLVEYRDGSMIAQMGVPDMRIPIQYALTYPARLPVAGATLDLTTVGPITFEPADPQRFPAIALGYRALTMGGTAGAVLNAANEVAVSAFVDRRIPFSRITEVVADTMNRHECREGVEMEEILQADAWARREAGRMIGWT